MKTKQAVCVLYQEKSKVLSVSRKNDPNDFGLPGGKVDANETLKAAAKRELFEETGLIVEEEDLCPLFIDIDGEFQVTTFEYNKFVDSSIIHSNESGVVKFLTQEELLLDSCSFASYNKKLFNISNFLINAFCYCIGCNSKIEFRAYEYVCSNQNCGWSGFFESDALYINYFYDLDPTSGTNGYFYQVSWYDKYARLCNDSWNNPIKEWELSLNSVDEIFIYKKEADELMLFI